MEDEAILSLIQETLCKVAPERADRFRLLTLDCTIRQLDIDSISTMEMIGHIEDHLARTFDEHELAKIQCLGDIATLIREGRIIR